MWINSVRPKFDRARPNKRSALSTAVTRVLVSGLIIYGLGLLEMPTTVAPPSDTPGPSRLQTRGLGAGHRTVEAYLALVTLSVKFISSPTSRVRMVWYRLGSLSRLSMNNSSTNCVSGPNSRLLPL